MMVKVRYLLLMLLTMAVFGCTEDSENTEYSIVTPTPRPTRLATDVPTAPAVVQLAAVEDTRTPTLAATSDETDGDETPTEDTSPTETTESPAESPEAEPSQTATETEAVSGATPTSIHADLYLQNTGNDFLVQISLGGDCFVEGEPIPGRLLMQNLGQDILYYYVDGAFAFSLNNSPVDMEALQPPPPTTRTDFVTLDLNARYEIPFEDLGTFLQTRIEGNSVDFEIVEEGLPTGDYWLTAIYRNPYDGLEPQPDGTYIIPQAAWTGIAVSREIRFSVVENFGNCSENN
jgi:hypothetical protein